MGLEWRLRQLERQQNPRFAQNHGGAGGAAQPAWAAYWAQLTDHDLDLVIAVLIRKWRGKPENYTQAELAAMRRYEQLAARQPPKPPWGGRGAGELERRRDRR
jgi:hypothetical protein